MSRAWTSDERKGGANMSSANNRKVGRDGLDGRVLGFGDAPGFPMAVEIAVNNGPISGIAASPDGARLLVTNYGSHSVSVIDTDTCRVVETVADLNEPFAIAMGREDAERAYVSTVSAAYDSIGVIDVPTNTGRGSSAGAQCQRPGGKPRRQVRLRQPKRR